MVNAVRNKLVHRVCAVIRNGAPYVHRLAASFTENHLQMTYNKSPEARGDPAAGALGLSLFVLPPEPFAVRVPELLFGL